MTVDATRRPLPLASDGCTPRIAAGMDDGEAGRLAAVARVLGDPIRIRILDVLRSEASEVCQCELAPLFEVSQPTLSHHLRKLADAGLITVSRRGKWAWYRLQTDHLEDLRTWLS